MQITSSDQSIHPQKAQYNAIDLFKFLCSIMMVTIHVTPFGANSEYAFLNYWIQKCAARIAVPFFFITSGFLLYKKSTYDNFDIKPSKDYVYKILRLYIIWSVIYLPLSLIDVYGDEKGIFHGILCYIRNFLLVGSYYHLWYLNATIVGVVIISFLLYKKCKVKNIIIISALFYTIGLLTQSWYGITIQLSTYLPHIWKLFGLLQKVIVTTRNGLFEGFLFIGIGMLFAFLKLEISVDKAVVGFAISYSLLFFEALIVKSFNFIRHADMYIFLVPTVFFLFCIAKNLKLKDSKIYLILRQLSSLIFYMHIWVGVAVMKISSSLFDIIISQTSFFYIITLSITIIGALGILRLSKCKYFHWLRYLYA